MAKICERVFDVIDLEIIHPEDVLVSLEDGYRHPPHPEGCKALIVGKNVVLILKRSGSEIIIETLKHTPAAGASFTFFHTQTVFWKPGQPRKRTIRIEKTASPFGIAREKAYVVRVD